MAQKSIGIEVDDSRVSVVVVQDGQLFSYNEYAGHDTNEAIKAMLAAEKIDAPTRVSLDASGTATRRLEVTADDVQSRQALEEAVFQAIAANRDTIEVAGLIPDISDLAASAVAPATVAVTPKEPVVELYKKLSVKRSTKIEIVPPPFTLVGRDGLHLAARQGQCELTFVSQGVPVAFRQLRASGLSRPATGLTSPAGDGLARIYQYIDGTHDPIAESELSRWATEVAHEAGETVAFWRRNGVDVPNDLWLSGPASRMTVLNDRLTRENFTLYTPTDVERALSAIDVTYRSSAVGAYLAAMSLGVGSPSAAFPNPVLISHAKARLRHRSTTRIVAITAVVTAVIALAGLGPLLLGRMDLADANSERAAAQARLAAVAATDAKVKESTELALVIDEHQSQWDLAKLYQAVLDTLPPSSALNQYNLAVVDNKVEVSLTAVLPPGEYEQITSWINVIQTDLSATDLQTAGFSRQADGVTANLTFTVSLKDFMLEDQQ